jgi:hypothetical protein
MLLSSVVPEVVRCGRQANLPRAICLGRFLLFAFGWVLKSKRHAETLFPQRSSTSANEGGSYLRIAFCICVGLEIKKGTQKRFLYNDGRRQQTRPILLLAGGWICVDRIINCFLAHYDSTRRRRSVRMTRKRHVPSPTPIQYHGVRNGGGSIVFLLGRIRYARCYCTFFAAPVWRY